MITGIGIDIIEVERVKKLSEKNPRFFKRIFTSEEIRYCSGKKNQYQHLAARFAAKEAFFKALGRKVGWTKIGVINLPSGKPQLEIDIQEALPFEKAHVSLAHLSTYATAIVILESSQ